MFKLKILIQSLMESVMQVRYPIKNKLQSKRYVLCQHYHHPSHYTSHWWAQGSSQNNKSWAVFPMPAVWIQIFTHTTELFRSLLLTKPIFLNRHAKKHLLVSSGCLFWALNSFKISGVMPYCGPHSAMWTLSFSLISAFFSSVNALNIENYDQNKH